MYIDVPKKIYISIYKRLHLQGSAKVRQYWRKKTKKKLVQGEAWKESEAYSTGARIFYAVLAPSFSPQAR